MDGDVLFLGQALKTSFQPVVQAKKGIAIFIKFVTR